MRATRKGPRYNVSLIIVVAAAICSAWACRAFADGYNACRMPPQISSSVTPNILVVMDYSGSMQLPAYIPEADPGTTYANSQVLDDYGGSHTSSWPYTPTTNYLGIFDSSLYYKYDYDYGWFNSIGSLPDDLNDNKRGTFAVGVSGNLLNWALSSRTDAVMAAMIGGKAWDRNWDQGGTRDCTDSSAGCYLKGEGCRRYSIENTVALPSTGTVATDAEFYIRPATKWVTSFTSANNRGIPSSGADENYPDDYTSSTQSPSYPVKDLFVTVRGHFRSVLGTSDHDGGSGNNHYWYELWQVVLTKRAYIDVTATTSAGYTPVISVSRTSITSGTYDGTGSTAQYLREPGTYWVKVTTSAKNKTGAYMITSNVQLAPDGHAGHNGAANTNTVGAIPYAAVRVAIAGSTQRTGVIQSSWAKAKWGFMYYKGDDDHRKGRLMLSCGEATDFTTFATYLEGKQDSGGQPYPYEGTPTGEALQQAKIYFKQDKTATNPAPISENKAKFTPNGQYDPYYAWFNGAYNPVACQKSYLILISDGNWYHNSGSTTEPVTPAHEMHTQDLRSDVDGNQTVTIFPIFAFTASGSDYTWGTNSMKWIAMYGGHRDLPNCTTGWPYPQTGIVTYPSTDTTFNITACTKAIPDSCCKEWDLNPDLYAPGDGQGKGIPDNYFETKTGDALKVALARIVGQIDQQNASSSAVATVAQQTGEGDIIIRGMFQAVPPTSETDLQAYYLWWGHIESYWPDSDGFYEFELPGRGDVVMCKDIRSSFSAPWRCWDGAMPSSLSGGLFPTADNRTVFTVKNGVKTTFIPANMTPTDLNVTGTDCGSGSECEKIVNWVRGKEYSGVKRPRTDKAGKTWVVGDLVYSTPVVVGPPSLGAVSDKAKALIGTAEHGIVACLDYNGNPTSDCQAATAAGFNKNRFFLNWRQFDPYSGASHSCSDNPQCPFDCGTDGKCPWGSGGGYPANYPEIKYRDKIVSVGGNDGMVHAFLLSVYDRNNSRWATSPGDAFNSGSSSCSSPKGYSNQYGDCGKQTDTSTHGNPYGSDKDRIAKIGTELWAYLPSNLLTEVKNLADSSYGMREGTGVCPHRFMVDLSPRAWEVFFDDQATSSSNIPWHTVLVGGERGGGDMYFALDVTDPYNPQVLWEYSVLKDMAHTFDFTDSTGAAHAFYSACQANALNPIAPGRTLASSCQVPVPPQGATDTLCTGCSSDSACYSKLKGYFTESSLWSPFDDIAYADLKRLPMSWSTPYLGRVKLPVTMNPCAPSGNGKNCGAPSTCTGSVSGVHNLAFIGGGIRQFDPDLNMFDSFSASTRDFYQSGFNRVLWDPFLLALDIRTGQNLFKYLWPAIDSAASTFFPEKKRGCNSSGANCTLRVPYAMSDPTVLDLWDAGQTGDSCESNPDCPEGLTCQHGKCRSGLVAGADGYDDTIYIGDMNGTLYGIKFNFEPVDPTKAGIYVDLWKTKPIAVNSSTTKDRASDQYRSEFQPITVQPAVSLEPPASASTTSQPVRVVVGAGKHDDVEGTFSGQDRTDQTDVAKMSLYNLRDVIDFSDSTTGLEGSAWTPGSLCNVKGGDVPAVTGGSFVWRVRANCLSSDCTGSITYRCTGEGTESGCTWTSTDVATGTTTNQSGCRWFNSTINSGDCCQADCAAPCWQCVFDLLDPGEKIIGKPVIAGQNVYVTTFKPTTNDPCQAGGSGFLYSFDYLCRPRQFYPGEGTAVTTFDGGASGFITGGRISLGLGVPSQPVLDSTGKYIIVQTSNAEISRVTLGPGPDGSGLFPLQERMTQIKGWTEKNQ